MKNIFSVGLLFLSFSAFAQDKQVYENHLLSESRKATCSPEQLRGLYDDLDKESNEFNQMMEQTLVAASEKKEKFKEDAGFEIMKRSMTEKAKIIAAKESFIYENCRVVYKSPRARHFEEVYKRDKLEKQRDYNPSEAYKPDLEGEKK